MSSESLSRSILWRQVWGLAAMLAAVLFSFMIYGVYQPKVLKALDFTTLAGQWGILQGCLGVIVEPGFGQLSDRILARTGSRLPQITVGVTIAGLLFVAIAWLIPSAPPLSLRWFLLALMILWLIAMIAVRGPIVALLRQFAPVSELPIANEVLILVIGLVSAIAPLLEEVLQSLQASLAFMAGAIALMVGATLLFGTMPGQAKIFPIPPEAVGMTAGQSPRSPQQLSLMLVIGLGTGCLLNLLITILPPILHTQIPSIRPQVITAIALAIAALATNPLGAFTQRWGAGRALQVGLGAIALLLLLTNVQLSPVPAVLLLGATGIAVGLVMVSMVPVALSYAPLQQIGLSTGLFFGGSGLGTAIVLFCNQPANPLTPGSAFGIGAIAFSISILCLARIIARGEVA